MKTNRYEIVLRRKKVELLTMEALAASAEIHPGLVERFVDYGLIEPVEWVGPSLLFDAAAVPRLQMIMRLRRDIGANLAGIGLIIDLLDRLRALQRENERLNARQ